MSQILALGAYLPRLRLSRATMANALGWLTGHAGSGTGTRTLAYWDEDSITMAVASARTVLEQCKNADIQTVQFATTTPPFSEPQNASFVHASLRLPTATLSQDITGTSRASLLALHSALENGMKTLITASDIPTAIPGSLAESRIGDGAAAVITGDGPELLRYLGGANISAPFIDRYRASSQNYPQIWEERWLRQAGYLELIPEAISQALNAAALRPDQVDYFIMPCSIPGVAKAISSKSKLTNAKLSSALADSCGDTATAHGLIMLAHALENVAPGQKILLVQFGQGATALVFEAGDAVTKQPKIVSNQLQNGTSEDNYMKLLAFRGQIDWDRGLRGRINVNEALTTAWRNADTLLGFVGGRCPTTGKVQFPPARLAADGTLQSADYQPWPLADRRAIISTFTADTLAFSVSPPNCYGLVDIDGGGRILMEFTDPEARHLAIGQEVRFVFRVKDLDPKTGYRRYFWKAVAA